MSASRTAIAVAAVGAVLTAGPVAPQVEGPRPSGARVLEEFPPLDSVMASSLQRWFTIEAADRRLAEAPDRPETVELLVEAGRLGDAVEVAGRIVATRPRLLPRTFEILSERDHEFRGGDMRGVRSALADVVQAVRARLSDLPEEVAARSVLELLPLEDELRRDAGNRRDDWALRLRDLIEEFPDTEAADLARVDLIVVDHRLPEMLDVLEEFARAHPGSAAGAKALHQVGFQLATNYATTGVVPRDSDPTDRFMRVVGIVEELENGRYPPCEWVDEARSLILRFWVPDEAVYALGNVDRVLAVYQRLLVDHFRLDDPPPLGSSASWVISSRIAELLARKGDEIAGVEGVLDELERSVDRPAAVRYLRALYYRDRWDSASAEGRAVLGAKAAESFSAVAGGDDDLYARKALAAMATFATYERDHARARDLYREYVERYPESTWTWMAMLRLGRAHEALGDWEAALEAYRRAVEESPSPPPALLGRVQVARAARALDRFEEAERAYRGALDAFDGRYGRRHSLSIRHALEPGQRAGFAPRDRPEEITQPGLARWVRRLERSLEHPADRLLERGRWLLEQERWPEARAALERLGREHLGSPLAPDARYLAHRARLEHALDLGDIENPGGDEAAALAELEALASEPWGFAVATAGIARAALLWKGGESATARALMDETLRAWQSNQAEHLPDEPETPLHADVSAIRDLVFRPAGDGLYRPHPRGARWNAHDWPEEPPPFVLLAPRIVVELAGGDRIEVPVHGPVPGVENVIYLPSDQRRHLFDVLDELGGTRKRQPRAIMETPNQPIGPSMAILDLWREFFPARQGHWFGWVVETYPIIQWIEFVDSGRIRARVPVTIGYSGATVVLEKRDGEWKFVEMTDFWIT